MRWLWFLGSMLCFAVLFRTTSVAIALLSLLGALIFTVIGVLAVAAQRIESRRQSSGPIFGPEEIRQMRLAEARRKAAQENAATQQEPAEAGTVASPHDAGAPRPAPTATLNISAVVTVKPTDPLSRQD